jgi:ABC-type amino acid transport substrate-binding protein
LNDLEKDYLNNHPIIKLCVDPDWLPYEKLDEQGEYSGLVAEYLGLISQRLNIAFDVLASRSWKETQQLYQKGTCDVVSALNKTVEREQYLNFTRPYINSPAVLWFCMKKM